MENNFVYVVLHENHHAEAVVEVFSSLANALNRANELLALFARWPEEVDKTLTESMKRMGWVFNAVYGPDGDNIRVIEVVLND
jgi:hypothetical protein